MEDFGRHTHAPQNQVTYMCTLFFFNKQNLLKKLSDTAQVVQVIVLYILQYIVDYYIYHYF